MNKCFKTKRNGAVNNTSIGKLGELRLPCVGKLNSPGTINGDDNSIVYLGRENFVAEIISSDNVTFTDGTTTLEGSTEKVVSKNILSNKNFVLSLTPKYGIKVLNFTTDANIAIEPNFDFDKLGILPNLRLLRIEEGYNGNIDYVLKNTKSLSYLNITGEIEFSVSSISTVLTSLIMIGASKVKGTIAEVAKIINTKDWAQVINQSSIEGDLADIPANVFYINLPSKGVTWTKGKRNSGSILAINTTNSKQHFVSHEDVDNMFVDQSTCTLDTNPSNNTHGGASKKIKIACPASYTPSSEAQAAIRTLYGKGLTNIIVNGKEMDEYK
jgi:hypothetical protein